MYQHKADSFSLYRMFHDKTLLSIEDCSVLGLCGHTEKKGIFPQGAQNQCRQDKSVIKRKVKRKGLEIKTKPPRGYK